MTETAAPKSQFLLKRKPSMTQKEFSDYWFTKHGAIVAPYFLSLGTQYYAQVQTHGPLTTGDENLKGEIGGWDDAAESVRISDVDTQPEPSWKKDYYNEVIRVDEKRFLVSEALQHFKLAPPGSMLGEKKVVIEDGMCVIDIPNEVLLVWRAYEAWGI